MHADHVQIVDLEHMPHGRTWTWHGAELLVIEATLTPAAREAAIAEAFADLQARSQRPPGPAIPSPRDAVQDTPVAV